jgi:hypothetical protein
MEEHKVGGEERERLYRFDYIVGLKNWREVAGRM